MEQVTGGKRLRDIKEFHSGGGWLLGSEISSGRISAAWTELN